MKKYDFLSKNTIYFIGIGGISMSGLAKMLNSNGKKVLGSDFKANKETKKLQELGIKVFIGHNEKHITKDIDLVVYSGAIPKQNVEILKAKKLGIKTIERGKLLGLVASDFENVIAISGSHGKTTITAMIGHMFSSANLNPTIHLGGNSLNFNDNTIVGGNKYFIVEACEYRNSFKYLKPDIAIISNIEKEHLDFYKSFRRIKKAFKNFAKRSKVSVCGQDVEIKKSLKLGVDWSAENIKTVEDGYTFDIYKCGDKYISIKLNLMGKYNIYNCLFAVIVADKYNIPKEIISHSFSTFKGVERRNEKIAKVDNCDIIIDYAHHPTEVKNSIEAFKERYEKILFVFQPHTFTRTLTLFDEFISVLKDVESLILYKTYPAREKEIMGGRSIDIHNNLINSKYFDDLDIIQKYLEDNLYNYHAVVILGAGDLAIDIKNFFSNK